MSALERGELRPSDFDATRAQLLVRHASDPAQARAALARPGGSRAAVVEALRPQVEALEGDPLRGREVFRCSSLRSLAGIEALTGLTSLDLEGCSSLRSLAGIEALTGLTSLGLGACSSLTSLTGIEAPPPPPPPPPPPGG